MRAILLFAAALSACSLDSNPCPGKLTCQSSGKCCPTGYPYHCGDQCYTASCGAGNEVCVDQNGGGKDGGQAGDVVQSILNGPTLAAAKTNWTATNACGNGVERYILAADGTARYAMEYQGMTGTVENITWTELNSTTILFSGSQTAVQLRNIVGSLSSGQFNAESLHTGGGNAACGYILNSGTF